MHSFINRCKDLLPEFIAPRHCEICNSYMGDSVNRLRYICDGCLDSIPYAPPPEEIINKFIARFPLDDIAVSRADALFAVAENHDYMEPVYSLKYKGICKIGIELGRLLGDRLLINFGREWDFIVPVPIHKARRRERGYNQSEYIAIGIEEVLSVPTIKDAIERRFYTKTQTNLSKEERKTNVLKAFGPGKKAELVKNKKVLLVDDVLTTGSTMNACANSLLDVGALSVDAAAIVSA